MQDLYFSNQSSKKKIENNIHSLWLENGILIETYHPDIKRVTLKIAKQIVADRMLISEGKTYPLLTDAGRAIKLEKDAEEYLSTNEAHYLIAALGLVVNNPISKIVGSLFLKFQSIKTPAKLFTTKEKALVWLKRYKHLN